MNNNRRRRSPTLRAMRIALAYGLAGAFWVVLTDELLQAWAHSAGVMTALQTAKGWGFVVVTAVVLFFLLDWQFRRDAAAIERSRRQRVQIRSLSRFRKSIIESAQVWIKGLDADARVTLWNRAAEQISGYSRSEVLGRKDIWRLLYPDEQRYAEVLRKTQAIIDDGAEVENFETTIRSKDGRQKVIAWNCGRLLEDSGRSAGLVAIGRDITAIAEATKALRLRERELATLLSNLPGMAYRCRNDAEWTMQFASSGCRELTGYESDEVVDNRAVSFREMVLPEDRNYVCETVRAQLAAKAPFTLEYRLRQRQGTVIWVSERGRAVDLEGGRFLEGICFDISQRKRLEQEMERLASHDQLTGLYNRRELDLRLRVELTRAQRYGRSLSVLWLDLDNFKEINDRYGHLAGDRLLQQVSRRLEASVRAVDCVARYGGEEIVVVLPEMSAEDAAETGERLRAVIAETPFPVADDQTAALTTSIGAASSPAHGVTADALYRAADDAMYRAKRAGRNRVFSAAG